MPSLPLIYHKSEVRRGRAWRSRGRPRPRVAKKTRRRPGRATRQEQPRKRGRAAQLNGFVVQEPKLQYKAGCLRCALRLYLEGPRWLAIGHKYWCRLETTKLEFRRISYISAPIDGRRSAHSCKVTPHGHIYGHQRPSFNVIDRSCTLPGGRRFLLYDSWHARLLYRHVFKRAGSVLQEQLLRGAIVNRTKY